jgi:hypothetical protein
MAVQHAKEIDDVLSAFVLSRRQEILQITQNATNPTPRRNLVEIQEAIDALLRAREQEKTLPSYDVGTKVQADWFPWI